MQKILLLGPQGSGKGTQATRLSATLGLPFFSMGQLLRDAVSEGAEFSAELQRVMDAGDLVPDALAMKVLGHRFENPDTAHGYILDGFPRDMAQFAAYDAVDRPTHVIVLEVPRDESLRRLSLRAKREGRRDDTPEVIARRLALYDEVTEPMIRRYEVMGVVRRVNGMGTEDEVEKRIAAAVTGVAGEAQTG